MMDIEKNRRQYKKLLEKHGEKIDMRYSEMQALRKGSKDDFTLVCNTYEYGFLRGYRAGLATR